MVAITETWLKVKETSTALADITPQGYSLIHEPRRGKQGGGVAIMTNNKFDVSPCKIPQYTSFESVGCKISAPLFSAHVLCIYRLIEYPCHCKKYRFFRKNLSVLLPCNPRRGLHGNSTGKLFLKSLSCLECTVFFDQFQNLLENLSSIPGELIILGDFNYI